MHCSKFPLRRSLCVLLGILSASWASWAADHWPQWRGPDGNGTSEARNLPLAWSLEKNILWKTELPSWSGSTPIVWGDRVFVISPSKSAPDNASLRIPPTTPQFFGQGAPGGPRPRRGGPGQGRGGFGGGRRGGMSDPGGQTLLLLCFSTNDGSLLWQRDLDTGNRMWMKGNNSSPSPVTDGKHVWALTGNGVVTAFDMEGKEIWKQNLQETYGRFGLNWGYGSSPLLAGGRLVIQVLQGMKTDDPSYIVAFDALSGKVAWRQERPTDAVRESPDAYTTPMLLEQDGQKQVVISGGDYVTGNDLETGREIWRAGGLNPRKLSNYRIVGSPVIKDGVIFATSRRSPVLALRPGGTGDVSESHLLWKYEGGGPDVPTAVSDGKYLYFVDDSGLATCLDAKSGERVWGPEGTAPGNVSASPLLAGDRLYILNEQAICTVIATGPEFKVLATNELDGSFTMSSMAAVDGRLFVRTATHLYCLGDKGA